MTRKKDKDHVEVGDGARWEDRPPLNLLEVTRLRKEYYLRNCGIVITLTMAGQYEQSKGRNYDIYTR